MSWLITVGPTGSQSGSVIAEPPGQRDSIDRGGVLILVTQKTKDLMTEA